VATLSRFECILTKLGQGNIDRLYGPTSLVSYRQKLGLASISSRSERLLFDDWPSARRNRTGKAVSFTRRLSLQ